VLVKDIDVCATSERKKEKAVGARECLKRINGRRRLRAISLQSLTGVQKRPEGGWEGRGIGRFVSAACASDKAHNRSSK
jgi:ribosomal protein L34E